MSRDTALEPAARRLNRRLTVPLLVGIQAAVVLVSLGALRWSDLVSARHPLVVLVGVPVLVYLTLALPAGVIQDVLLRFEEQTDETDETGVCWGSIRNRTVLWLNAAIVLPVVVWGLPITGTLGYATEAVAEVVPGWTVSADHTATGGVVIGLVLVGSAWSTLGVLVTLQMYLRPTFSEERLQTYLALRSSLPVRGTESIAPRRDGGEIRIETTELADACVQYRLAGRVSEHLDEPVDVERIARLVETTPASMRTRFGLLISPHGRFLSVMFGGMLFIFGISFGLTLDSIQTATLVGATALGVLSQVTYRSPFVSGAPEILE
ncbi:hypothetical protein GRX03_06350 [Halovenus sp. WSH3]|uniref:Uncharacterized protein n=1 Tax=Halovenus carboxidivorans TaxID=2692199 RepID=A0A6B0SZU6_9EURY|nr:hypothetical protein [Halovenus carboxidivorans]MXR51224.1 hypothetical protein [Halovenus carboxidivorans]